MKVQMFRKLMSYPKIIFRFILPVHVHLKMDKVDLKKKTPWNFFYIFFQSTYQGDMKNVVECYKDFFGYFNALETHGVVGFV